MRCRWCHLNVFLLLLPTPMLTLSSFTPVFDYPFRELPPTPRSSLKHLFPNLDSQACFLEKLDSLLNKQSIQEAHFAKNHPQKAQFYVCFPRSDFRFPRLEGHSQLRATNNQIFKATPTHRRREPSPNLDHERSKTGRTVHISGRLLHHLAESGHEI